jgi:hypothetical protein
MPIYMFKCDNGHTLEKARAVAYKNSIRIRCKECGLFLRRDYQGEHSTRSKVLHLDYEKDPISHLSKKRSFKGITIENLTPEPVFVRSAEQYQNLLKQTHSKEKEY